MPRNRKIRHHLLICTDKSCRKEGGEDSAKALKQSLKKAEMRETVAISEVDCLDQCDYGPVMAVYPDGVWYQGVDKSCARKIVESHIKEGVPVEENILLKIGHASSDGKG